MSLGKLYIGTSGWMYPHWKGNFYPEIKQGTSSAYSENLPQKDWLKFYSRHFNSVEINSSFYRQPQASTFKKWKDEVLHAFEFRHPSWIDKEVLTTLIYINRVETTEELKKWAEKIKIWLGQGKDVYAYFNNDALGFVFPNALTLKKLILL